jgi:zinc and cadmium transporter
LIDSGTGIIATIAIIAHNIPLEVGEFGLQLKSGFSKKQTIIRNLLASSTLLIGAMFAFQIGSFVELPLGYIYGGIAGFFIYIALSDIVPTIHSSESKRYGLQTGFLILGLFFGVIVSSYAHQYLDVGHEHESVSGHSNHEEESESGHSNHED